VRSAVFVVSLAIFYFVAGKFGLRFATFNASATPIWAPSGVALAGLLLIGYRFWPAIFAGAFLVNFTTDGSIAMSIVIAAGDTLEALLGAYLVNRFADGKNTFYRTQNVFKFLLLAVLISPTIAATIGATSLCFGGYASWSGYYWLWLTWWLGDASGNTIVAPFLILWYTNPRLNWSRAKAVEAVLLLLSLAAAAGVVFGNWLPETSQGYPLNFFFVSPLLWAAFRLGLRETATATLILSAIAVFGTLNGFGPFAQGTRDEALMLLQTFAGVIGFMSLAVASEVSQRPKLDQARAEAEKASSMLRRLQMVTDVALFQETRESLLHELLDRLRSALDSDTATILLLEPDGMHLSPTSSAGLREEIGKDIRVRLGQGAAGRIAKCDEGLVLNDLTKIDVVSPFLRRKVRSVIGAPLKIQDRLIGVIHAGSTTPREFTVDDLDLIRRVAQRAALAIERTQLLERERGSREAAEAANRAKDEFLAMLGHELRNPLAAISVAAQVLSSDRRQELETQTHAIIVRQVEQLLRLVDDLLDVARVTTRKVQLRRQPTDIAECVTGCVKQLTAAKHLENLHIAVEANPVWVDGDPDRLAQIVINLASNAIKYTPSDGRVLVSVTAENEFAVIRVQDTGVGIPADLLPRIFDLFVQGEVDLDRTPGGLGIGLTLVRRLAELHGGYAEAASEGQGRGSTFTVRLPRIAAPLSSTAALRASGSAAAKTPRRILIIEDNADVRESLRILLELSGHEVYEASDGREGVEKAAAVGPDLALVDIGLPGLDGYNVAKRIRANSASRDTILVALTGYAQPEYRKRADDAGFDGFLAKPIDAKQLAELIETLSRATPPALQRNIGPT
jgi:signal transduction histidine kinase/ActR/RegA family two-component response regulator